VIPVLEPGQSQGSGEDEESDGEADGVDESVGDEEKSLRFVKLLM
jgi:hypothetical protein